MTKLEFIEKYGEESYQRQLESSRKWKNNNKEQVKATSSEWYNKNKDRAFDLNKKWRDEHPDAYNIKYKTNRQKGRTVFCKENCELIENYNLAKADKFNRKKWHLHHRLENYWSSRK